MHKSVILAATLAGCVALSATALADDHDWPMYNRDAQGSRANPGETILGPGNVGQLQVRWAFPTEGVVSGTPAVRGNMIYAGDSAGHVYAVNTDGQLVWQASGLGFITDSAAVTGTRVVIAGIDGWIHGLDRRSGTVEWSYRPSAHPLSAIWGSATVIDNKRVVIGVASNEEEALLNPSYPCCSTRGAVVMLDPTDGTVLWQTPTISDAEQAAGASGASVWSTPTYDADLGLVFVTTGNNFSQPTTGTSDAIIALDAATGDIVWTSQLTPGDIWNDLDVGDSPQVYTLPDGQRVVGAGQKSGFYYVVDAATGAPVSHVQAEVGGLTGGLFADSAVAGGVVFANGVNWPNSPSLSPPPVGGDLIAISGDGSTILWDFFTPYSPDLSGVAVANGVVYFQSAFDGSLYALDAQTGTPLLRLAVGLSTSGPAIANGHVYLGTGSIIPGLATGSGAIVSVGP